MAATPAWPKLEGFIFVEQGSRRFIRFATAIRNQRNEVVFQIDKTPLIARNSA